MRLSSEAASADIYSRTWNREDAMRRAKFEVFRHKNKKHGWRLRAKNGEIVASGEGYASTGNAKRGIASFVRAVDEAIHDFWNRPDDRSP